MFEGLPSAVEAAAQKDPLVRVVDRMAYEIYDALRKRQRCTACGGEGVVITQYRPQEGEEQDPDTEDLLLSNICGCVKHAEALLKKYVLEYEILASLAEQDALNAANGK